MVANSAEGIGLGSLSASTATASRRVRLDTPVRPSHLFIITCQQTQVSSIDFILLLEAPKPNGTYLLSTLGLVAELPHTQPELTWRLGQTATPACRTRT